jgi:hypothetical protein
MINGTCRTIVSNSALGIFDNPISSELTQPRANIAGRYTQALGNFLCREAVGRAPQDLEDAILKFRHHISPNLGRFSKATNLLLLPLKALHCNRGVQRLIRSAELGAQPARGPKQGLTSRLYQSREADACLLTVIQSAA